MISYFPICNPSLAKMSNKMKWPISDSFPGQKNENYVYLNLMFTSHFIFLLSKKF